MILDFIKELRTSKDSLDEILRKHGLNLKTALIKTSATIPYENTPTGVKGIQYHGGTYAISKNNIYYGKYNTLIEAIQVRDNLEKHNWNKRNLDKICEEVGVKRRKHGKRIAYNRYTLWDVRKTSYKKNLYTTKRFRARYNSEELNIGCFIDPFTCELIHDLITEAVNNEDEKESSHHDE